MGSKSYQQFRLCYHCSEDKLSTSDKASNPSLTIKYKKKIIYKNVSQKAANNANELMEHAPSNLATATSCLAPEAIPTPTRTPEKLCTQLPHDSRIQTGTKMFRAGLYFLPDPPP